MSYIVFVVVVVLVLLWYSLVVVDDCKNLLGNRKFFVLVDDVYEVLVNFVEGKFLLLVKEWMKVICIVIVRYWRVKGKILVKDDNGKKVFYYEGCCMLRFLEVNKIVVEEFD